MLPPARAHRLLFGAAVLGALVTGGSLAEAENKWLEIPSEAEAKQSLAYHYANLSNEEAFQLLRERGIPWEPAHPPLRGVRAPIRLTGNLHGVWIHSALPPEKRADSMFEILDARLALALNDFCGILAVHDIVEVVHFTMYRPPTDTDTAGDGNGYRFRHPGGLAFDFGAAKKSDGEWLAVGPHWAGFIGAKTCGTNARRLENRKGRELRSIMCEAYDQRIFTYMLSPHYDIPHDDHLHLEIKPGMKWFIAH